MQTRNNDNRHIWHPFTQHETEVDPIVIASASGASLFDDKGHEYLDLISSWWTCLHGHSHPVLNKALIDQVQQVDHVMFAGFTHKPAAELAAKLCAVLPGDLNKVFFSDNGSTAVEVALKMAYQYWKNKGETRRTKFLAFDGAYHGDTFGAMAVGRGSGFFKLYDDLLFDVTALPFPQTWDGDETVQQKEEEAVKSLKKMLQQNTGQIAAIIIEPLLQGAGGMRMCRPSFIRDVVNLAKDSGILVIFDEVAVGFGRLGSMFACLKCDVQPDMICLSKGLTAGYLPMSVTVATDAVYNAFLGNDFSKALAHGHSFTANPLACAVAGQSLDLFSTEKTLEKIAAIEAQHKNFLLPLKAHSGVRHARVMGSVLAFEIAGGSGYKSGTSEGLKKFFLSKGLNIRPLGNTVYLLPPYCITAAQLQRAYDGIFEGLSMLQKQAA